MENASTSKRTKKGRVNSQAVVKVTDENDAPVAGIAVTFAIPQLTAGGASFANGAATALVTTNAAGLASSGSFAVTAGTSFSMSVSASVPGGVVTASVPVSTGAAGAAGGAGAAAGAGASAGGGAGLSTGVIVGIVAGVGAAAAGGAVAAIKAGGGGKPSGTIGAAGAPTFGHP